MYRTIPEPDWKVFRRLHPLAVQRYFDKLMAELGRIVTDTTKETKERYWEVHDFMRDKNKEMDWLLDDLRRSTAFEHIAAMCRHGLFTDEEIAQFSHETRQVARVFGGFGD